MTDEGPRGTPWGCLLSGGGLLLVFTALICSGGGWLLGTRVMPEEPIQTVSDFDAGDELVPLTVRQLYPDPHGYGITLELEAADGRVLPMVIGSAEADAISRELDGLEMPRPMTHDLLALVIDGLDARLEAVAIRRLEDQAFHAALYLRRADGSTVQIDSRSSDAVALALRAAAPIYGHADVLEDAALR